MSSYLKPEFRGRNLTTRITQMFWYKNKTSLAPRKELGSHSTHWKEKTHLCFQHEGHIWMKYNFHFYLEKSYNMRVKAKCSECVSEWRGGFLEMEEDVSPDGRGRGGCRKWQKWRQILESHTAGALNADLNNLWLFAIQPSESACWGCECVEGRMTLS